MEYLNFNGKKYLIFGASSGIGKQVALQLSQLGARLVLVGRNEEKLQETLEMLDGDGHNILICDVSDFSAAQNAVKTAVSMDNIKLDGCVFSAGIYAMLPLGAVTEEKINKIFATNIVSMMAIAKAFSSKRISNNGASFVSVSSRAALLPDKSQGVYGASKAAINSYTVAAAKEMSNRLIRFNAVCPEAVDTEMGAGDSYFSTLLTTLLQENGALFVGDHDHMIAQLKHAMDCGAKFAAKVCSLEGAFGYGTAIID